MATDTAPADRIDVVKEILVVLRVHGDSNKKSRPSWYSKAICVASLLESSWNAERNNVLVQTVAFIDLEGGGLDPVLAEQVEKFDFKIHYSAGTSRSSWCKHLRIIERHGSFKELSDRGVIYFVEDDHLHSNDAIIALSGMPTEYGLTYSLSKDPSAVLKEDLAGVSWVETMRGVSSFGIRKNAFNRDKKLLKFMSYAGPAFDLLTWSAVRGKTYFRLPEIVQPFHPKPPFERSSLPKVLYQVAWRLIANFVSLLRPRRVVAATMPSLSTHAEPGWIAPGCDWTAISEQTRRLLSATDEI